VPGARRPADASRLSQFAAGHGAASAGAPAAPGRRGASFR